ncbi:hypothetical protein KUTeg_017898 [Tegillarca granosa]|uniref:Uncharacterized protein n=1 Tax=Tegillarca granosa TaxID=220873 RepID=A0ABQ9EL86_TEGGR|nr:hypothetical protein KUTeg_017898 [Tegillarca granosa]
MDEKKIALTDEHIMCFYNGEGDRKEALYPTVVKLNGPKSDALIVPIGNNAKSEIVIPKFELVGKEIEKFTYFSNCFKKRFSGLEYKPLQSVWVDKSEPSASKTFMEDCFAELKEHTWSNNKTNSVAQYLIRIYHALTGGFHNSMARNAMVALLDICCFIVDVPSYAVSNVGGSSSMAEECSQIASFYLDVREISDSVMQELSQFNSVEPTNSKTVVPDFAAKVIGCEKEKFFLLGGCKSSCSLQDIENQTWHQALHGLCESDSVYGIGARAVGIVFMQLKKNYNMLLTNTKEFDFFLGEGSSYFSFDTKKFCDAVKYMICLIKENNSHWFNKAIDNDI